MEQNLRLQQCLLSVPPGTWGTHWTSTWRMTTHLSTSIMASAARTNQTSALWDKHIGNLTESKSTSALLNRHVRNVMKNSLDKLIGNSIKSKSTSTSWNKHLYAIRPKVSEERLRDYYHVEWPSCVWSEEWRESFIKQFWWSEEWKLHEAACRQI